jgi:hypothetical protein
MGRTTYIAAAADAAVERYGDKAPDALIELITAAIELGDDDLVADFDRIFRQVERQLAADGSAALLHRA